MNGFELTILVVIMGESRGAHPAPSPPKIGKNMIFWRKIVICHTKYPQTFSPLPPQLEKNMICWRKIVIFHTKYPKNVRASHRSAQFFLNGPPLT
jgi:hypothetical protein